MFHIASQTITEPALDITMTFGCDPADYSKATLSIVGPKGTMDLVFNRGGGLVSHTLVEADKDPVVTTIAQPIIPDPSWRPPETAVNTVETITKPVETADEPEPGAAVAGYDDPFAKSDGDYVKPTGKPLPYEPAPKGKPAVTPA